MECVSDFLVPTVGSNRAVRMGLTGERIAAAEASALGMVSDVVDDARLYDAAEALLARLWAEPPSAMAALRRSSMAYGGLDAALNAEARAFGDCAAPPDFERDTLSVLARRPAEFG